MNASELKFAFDEKKFDDVVHWICANADYRFGKTKLHKVLYFSDMLFFMSEGRPLTGESYRKQQFGPTAHHLDGALRRLSREGKIDISTEDFFGFLKHRYIAKARPEPSALGNSEIAVLREVLDHVSRHSASEISDLSHTLAWEIAENGAEIPYESVFLWEPVAIDEDDLEWAEREVKAAEAYG